MGAIGQVDPPSPSPEMLAAVRGHVTSRYARGVDELFWELEKRPMRDRDAVRAVMTAYAGGKGVDALDLGAVLVIVQALRLELDLLEADVLDAAVASGISRESTAAVLELPDADAVRSRHEMLTARRGRPGATPALTPDAGRSPG